MRKACEETKLRSKLDNFQQRLLDHVEMVYRVAIRLSGSPRDAELLTRVTMSRIWYGRNTLPQPFELKAELLSRLRQTFLDKQRLDLRVKTRWEYDSHEVDRPLASDTQASRTRGEKKEDSILVAF